MWVALKGKERKGDDTRDFGNSRVREKSRLWGGGIKGFLSPATLNCCLEGGRRRGGEEILFHPIIFRNVLNSSVKIFSLTIVFFSPLYSSTFEVRRAVNFWVSLLFFEPRVVA